MAMTTAQMTAKNRSRTISFLPPSPAVRDATDPRKSVPNRKDPRHIPSCSPCTPPPQRGSPSKFEIRRDPFFSAKSKISQYTVEWFSLTFFWNFPSRALNFSNSVSADFKLHTFFWSLAILRGNASGVYIHILKVGENSEKNYKIGTSIANNQLLSLSFVCVVVL